MAQVTYLGQGELQVLQRHRQRQPGNDIWSISWYDINSTHEHVVLLFIEFSDILKALTLKQIIMITRFIAAGQRNIRIIATRKGERNEWEKKTATKYKNQKKYRISHLNDMFTCIPLCHAPLTCLYWHLAHDAFTVLLFDWLRNQLSSFRYRGT